MVITDKDVRTLSTRTLLEVDKIKGIINQCNSLGDLLNLDLGASNKELESRIKNTMFVEILKIRKGKECRI